MMKQFFIYKYVQWFNSSLLLFHRYYYILNVHVNNTTVHIFDTACSRIFRTHVRIDLHLLSFSSLCQLHKLTFHVDSANQLPQHHLGTTPACSYSVSATRNAHTTWATRVINHPWRHTAVMVFGVTMLSISVKWCSGVEYCVLINTGTPNAVTWWMTQCNKLYVCMWSYWMPSVGLRNSNTAWQLSVFRREHQPMWWTHGRRQLLPVRWSRHDQGPRAQWSIFGILTLLVHLTFIQNVNQYIYFRHSRRHALSFGDQVKKHAISELSS